MMPSAINLFPNERRCMMKKQGKICMLAALLVLLMLLTMLVACDGNEPLTQKVKRLIFSDREVAC